MNLLNLLSNIGTSDLSSFEAKRIRLVNRLCLSLGSISLLFILPWGLKKNITMVSGNVVLLIFYLLGILSNYKKFHAFASMLLIFTTSTGIFALSGMIGLNSPLHYCLTSFSAFSIVLFKRENRPMIFIGIIYPLILLFILIYNDFNVFPGHIDKLSMGPLIDYIINFIIILTVIICFYNYYMGAEDKLRSLHEKHLKNQELLHEERARSLVNSKMAALGEMAGGIAHEINNPLFLIKAISESMIRDISKNELSSEQIIKKCKMIESTCSRMSNIIRSLKTISGSSENCPLMSHNIQDFIEDTLILCQHRFYLANYPVNVIYETHDYQVMVRPVEVVQVLVNLLNNAHDALEGVANPHVDIRIKKEKNYLIINVEDNGSGIRQEDQDKVFETFYTSKAPDKGTGLGLPISKKLAQNNNGDISFTSVPGKTIFSLKLPQ